jgi:hypothetical protein
VQLINFSLLFIVTIQYSVGVTFFQDSNLGNFNGIIRKIRILLRIAFRKYVIRQKINKMDFVLLKFGEHDC